MEPLLTQKQVAHLLNVRVCRLARWRRDGYGPPYVRLPAGHPRYPQEALRRWIRSQATTETTFTT